MILPITKYGHPILRKKGARIEEFTPAIKELIADMLETMRVAHGVGLAAQQVGRALQLMVLDVRGVKDRPSSMEINNQPVEVDAYMPMVLVNPEFKPGPAKVEGPEGCLSFPELYADIIRAATIDVIALNERGEVVQFHCGGLLARAIQHEKDHLEGILFVDRMGLEERLHLKPQLEDLFNSTKEELARVKKQPVAA